MSRANLTNSLVIPESTTVFPYYDDWDEDKGFRRIVFRPGYPVQARELTQVQTILQNQIERFGQHIFVNGSSVIGGEVRYIDTITLNVDSTYAGTTIDVSDFKDKTIKYASGNNTVIARVIQVSAATDTDPASLHIGQNYITGTEFAAGDSIKVDGEEVYANIASSGANSKGTLAFIDDSIFFYNGYFIKTPKQIIVASKYSANASCKIGLEFDESIVTEVSDSSLLDPALESSNYQAPGAARYKSELTLAKRDLDSTDDTSFVEISRIIDGVLYKNITTPVYSEIEEVFARRTYDESGNYTVRPFRIAFEESTSNTTTNVAAIISEGKGYILGFEYETIAPQTLDIPRARTVANVTNFNESMNYGNYVIVDGLQGNWPIDSMGLFDIHCVPYSNVAFANTVVYNSTKIGTGRLRNIEFFSGDTDVSARKHEFYIFDTNFSSLTGNANVVTTVAQNQINLSSNAALGYYTSAANGAYNGATVLITTGTSSGDQRTITWYNGITKVANVDSNFTTTLDATSKYSLNFDFGEAESFIINDQFTPSGAANCNTNITILSKTTGTANGDAFVFEASLLPLVFELPERYVVAGSATNRQYVYRKTFTNIQFTNGKNGAGTVQAGTDEDFVGTTATSNIASTVTDNFLIVISNPQSSGRPKGDQIKANTVVSGAPESVIFDTANTSDTFIATVFAKVNAVDTAATPRVKTLMKANVSTFATEAVSNTFISSSTGSNTEVYLSSAQVYIQNPSRDYSKKESLYISDVIAIKKIYDLAGASKPAAGASLTSYSDVTNSYIFDNGQRDSHYDHASIRLRPGAAPPAGPLVVCCRYYSTTTDKGHFSVDSYPSLGTEITEEDGTNIGTGYSIIPNYNGMALRDSIDFRPVRTSGANTPIVYTLTGAKIPVPASDFQLDYDYYLGRRDLIVATANKTIERVEGIPAKYPQDPKVPTRSMVLYALSVPPYTAEPTDISVKFVENKRYTMRDIGLLDTRLSNVEYYVRLNTLEKNALDMHIKDVDGLDRSKNGIFVDNFLGHSFGDSELFDYAIAVDVGGRWTGDGLASCEYAAKAATLDPDKLNGTNVAFGVDKMTLSYTVVPAITQNTATKWTPVADYLYASFEGNIITIPEADIWRDLVRNVVINRINEVNQINLRRYITPSRERIEAQQIANGMALIDIINDWASGSSYSSGLQKTLTNIERSALGESRLGTLAKNQVLFTQDELTRLNNIF